MSIQAYIDTVSGAVGGPRRCRQELLTELADGLWDATAAYQARGLSRAEAEQRAVDEAGEADQLAADYREVLVAAQGRRTSVLFALSTLLTVLTWDVVWRLPAVPQAAPPPLAMLCWRVMDWVAALVALAAVVVLGLLVLAARLGRRTHWLVAVQAGLGGLAVLVTLVCSLVGNLVDHDGMAASLANTPSMLLGWWSLSMLAWQSTSVWRSVRAAHACIRPS